MKMFLMFDIELLGLTSLTIELLAKLYLSTHNFLSCQRSWYTAQYAEIEFKLQEIQREAIKKDAHVPWIWGTNDMSRDVVILFVVLCFCWFLKCQDRKKSCLFFSADMLTGKQNMDQPCPL